jgi:7tm Chemosensory receptor
MEKLATTISRIQVDHHKVQTFETRDILQNFYCQVTLQPITFTASKFVTINMELLASIIAGVLSYLIILVQFYAS